MLKIIFLFPFSVLLWPWFLREGGSSADQVSLKCSLSLTILKWERCKEQMQQPNFHIVSFRWISTVGLHFGTLSSSLCSVLTLQKIHPDIFADGMLFVTLPNLLQLGVRLKILEWGSLVFQIKTTLWIARSWSGWRTQVFTRRQIRFLAAFSRRTPTKI